MRTAAVGWREKTCTSPSFRRAWRTRAATEPVMSMSSIGAWVASVRLRVCWTMTDRAVGGMRLSPWYTDCANHRPDRLDVYMICTHGACRSRCTAVFDRGGRPPYRGARGHPARLGAPLRIPASGSRQWRPPAVYPARHLDGARAAHPNRPGRAHQSRDCPVARHRPGGGDP